MIEIDLAKSKRVLSKMSEYNRHVRKAGSAGTKPSVLYLNPNNICNFNCVQCFAAASAKVPKVALTIEKLRSLADEADELGIYEIDIQGGEPLIYDNLFEMLAVFGPERFYLSITTNGYLLDEKMARRLADAGVSRVRVSLDSMEAETHDGFRNRPGAFVRALEGLENVKNAGMVASVNFLVGHHNVPTGEVEQLCDFCRERGYHIGLITLKPVGNLQGKLEGVLDESDRERLNGLRGKYKNLWRDLWPVIETRDRKPCSCPIVTRPYITPRGDVLPCPFVHITIGNIHEKPLKEILEYGFTIKRFRDESQLCLSGEDGDFAKKYLQGNMSVMNPLPAAAVFGPEDFIKP